MAKSSAWWAGLEARLFTRFRARMAKMDSGFGGVQYTREPENKAPPVFPTVCFREVAQGVPAGGGYSLEDAGINAVDEYIEVAVSHNGPETELRSLSALTEAAMQSMGFRRNGNRAPISYEGENVIRSVARFQQRIGVDDALR